MAQGYYFNDAQIFLISLLSYFLQFYVLFVILQERDLAFFPLPKGLLIFVEKGLGSQGTLVF